MPEIIFGAFKASWPDSIDAPSLAAAGAATAAITEHYANRLARTRAQQLAGDIEYASWIATLGIQEQPKESKE